VCERDHIALRHLPFPAHGPASIFLPMYVCVCSCVYVWLRVYVCLRESVHDPSHLRNFLHAVLRRYLHLCMCVRERVYESGCVCVCVCERERV